MRYSIPIILFCCAFCGNIKKYHKCAIYEYYNDDSEHMILRSIGTFNDNGQILSKKNLEFRDSSTSDTGERTFYVYNDTLLVKEISSDWAHRGDTHIRRYYYNQSNKVVMLTDSIKTQPHPVHNDGMWHEDEINWDTVAHKWQTPDTTFYKYDIHDNKIETNRRQRSVCYFFYDNLNRLIKDSSAGDVSWKRTYEYNDSGYREFIWHNIDGANSNSAYVSSFDEYIYDNEKRLVKKVAYSFDDYSVPDKRTQYIFSTTLYQYYSNGKIKSEKLYERGTNKVAIRAYIYE